MSHDLIVWMSCFGDTKSYAINAVYFRILCKCFLVGYKEKVKFQTVESEDDIYVSVSNILKYSPSPISLVETPFCHSIPNITVISLLFEE